MRLLAVLAMWGAIWAPLPLHAVDFTSDVAPILVKYCTGCHNAEEKAGDFSLELYDDVARGLADGPLVLPGDAKSSRLIRVLTGAAEPSMPPDDQPGPTAEERERIVAWIDAGALGPEGVPAAPRLATPIVRPAVAPESGPISALALSPEGSQLAVGRFARVELVESVLQVPVRTLTDFPGKVNALNYSVDGQWLAVASGTTGLFGRADVYRVETGERVQSLSGHRDVMYDAEFDPAGKILATASYDKTIILWDLETGKPLRTIAGHHGAVFDVAFSADATLLASASADETVKVWDVSTGERIDTLGQPVAEQYCVAFHPRKGLLAAGGADNRVRVWRVETGPSGERQAAGSYPLVYARFAHDEPIVALRFSPDGERLLSAASDRSVKLWETQEFARTQMLPEQPDVPSALAFAPAGDRAVVARLDGTWGVYSLGAFESPDVGALAAGDAPSAADVDAASSAPAAPAERHEATESEPNDEPASSMAVTLPALVRGRIASGGNTGVGDQGGEIAQTGDGKPDVDWFRIRARAGETLLLETNAARNGSLLDSKIEVLDAEGRPIPRVVLQAVRDSYFSFRGKDSDQSGDVRLHNWEEMDVNQYLYAAGEVNKLWIYPRGPDSGFGVYPGEGKRYAYFDTTSVVHALNEPCWIVEPHPPGTRLSPNGLPEFTIYYENDDDGWREFGVDSRLTFVAPSDAEYLVRVSDVRGFGGDKYDYELTIRAPQPDFDVRVEMTPETIPAGSGREFRVVAQRKDGFDGEIRLDLSGLPPGFTATSPVVVEAGQIAAFGAISAAAGSADPGAEPFPLKATATARISDRELRKEIAFAPKLKLGDPPRVYAWVARTRDEPKPTPDAAPLELTIAPGQTISAVVRLERQNGFDELVSFGNEGSGRNMPHGIYVDNLGLNGLLVTQGADHREFFITASHWVPETSRLFHLTARIDGDLATLPVLLHVRNHDAVAER